VIQQLSDTPFDKINPEVLSVIRLGLYQILFLSRIPASAAVNDSVEIAKKRSPRWVVPFVNAVLRSAVRKAEKIPLPVQEDDPVAAIAIGESHPSWMVERWVKRMGVEETKGLCRANNRIPPVTIRTNTLKVSRDSLSRSLSPHVREIRPTRFAPDGLTLRGLKQPVGDMSAFQNGWFQVQDEAAQLITHFLDPNPGQVVLDACAGLGGKTGHIAQLMNNRGRITAGDHQSRKLSCLKTSMERLAFSSVATWHHDLLGATPENLTSAFDRILLDAPCSGLGVIRRNPDIKWKKRKKDLTRLQKKQQHFLARLAPLLKQGGRLVYCVCSLEPEEGSAVVEGFLKSHPDFVIDDSSAGLCEVSRPFVDESGAFRTLPQEYDMDGFFAVRLKKDRP
jgi:16S rRNA (cytosine967-C5)-methyltransferase